MKRTIVYFTDTKGFGGAEQALLHLIQGLDRAIWHPILFYHASSGIQPLLEKAAQLKIELRGVPELPLGLAGARQVVKLARLIKAAHPVIFHAHLTWPLACKFGLVAAILARTPVIIATEQLFVETRYDFSTRLQLRLIAGGVTRYIAVSEGLAQRLRQTFKFPAKKLQVVHNCIPLELFDRPNHSSNPLRSELLNGAERAIVLTNARLDWQKGHIYLLQAAVQLPEAQFVLVGDGPERASLEALAQKLGIADRVSFLGYRQDIAELLSACDIFVLPSLFEGLPLSVLEAMATGKPVVATAVVGTTEAIVTEETGLLVPAADVEALAQAIRRLLSNPALCQKLALKAKSRVRQQFGVETMVKGITGVYEELLQNRERRYATK